MGLAKLHLGDNTADIGGELTGFIEESHILLLLLLLEHFLPQKSDASKLTTWAGAGGQWRLRPAVSNTKSQKPEYKQDCVKAINIFACLNPICINPE